MELLPETATAINEYGPFVEDDDLKARLLEMAESVRQVVPSLVGLSLAWRELGATFTVVASNKLIAALDGLQYLDGGPCVAAVDEERVVQYPHDDLLQEAAWDLFARATAEAGVASTLTLPVMIEAAVVGSVNLYASAAEAFTGKHEHVAAAVGGWAPGAVANADLSFSTRRTAQDAPRILAEEVHIQIAVGVLIARYQTTAADARDRLRDAAARAGISEAAMAGTIVGQVAQAQPPEAED